MNSMSKDDLVEIITREVLNIIKVKSEDPQPAQTKPKVLILGPQEKLPPRLLMKYNAFDVSDYVAHGDISRYQCVYITEISLAQLSDIALGRDERPYQCAVTNAILNGTNVYLLTEALSYHRYVQTANKAFYDMIKSYEQKMTGFGVSIIPAAELSTAAKLSTSDENINQPALDQTTVLDCTDKVITGKKAEELCCKLNKSVNLKKGTILTPLAKDAFSSAKIKIDYV